MRTKSSKPRAHPISISESNPWDRKVVALTKKGFTAKAIMRSVPLTEGQIRNRQVQLHVSSLDYRRGQSPDAMQAIRRLDKMMGSVAQLRQQIDWFIGRQEKRRNK